MVSPDILVLESDDLVVVAAYILPEGKDRWLSFSDVSPYDKLEETLTLLSDEPRQVVLLGDLNARTSNISTDPSELRSSEDDCTTTRGNSLLRLCRGEGYRIFNGLNRFGCASGRMTSHHKGCGEAVIDYVVGNGRALDDSLSLEILPSRPEWSDHSEVVLRIRGNRSEGGQEKRKPRRRRQPYRFPLESEVDQLVLEAFNSIPTSEEEVRLYYGAAYCDTNPIQIYVDGSSTGNGSTDSRAGAGIYFGERHRLNAAVRVPDSQTNNRAEIFAVWYALRTANTHQSLTICTDSEYVINMLTEWAPDRSGTGWRVVNGDIFRDVAFMLCSRPAPVLFRKVKAHSGNAHNDAADTLAKQGTTAPSVAPYEAIDRVNTVQSRCGCDACMRVGPVVQEEKIRWEMKRRRGGKDNAGMYRESREEAESALTVDGLRERDQQRETRIRLFSAETPFEFYKEFKRLRDPRKTSSTGFDEEDMRDVFQIRMNPILPVPISFDPERMSLTRDVAATALQDGLDDRTPLKSLSRPFELGEVEVGKLNLRKRWGSAVGEDEVSYRDICRMDNACLLELMNRCLQLGEIPTSWLRTRLVGLCKKGKAKDDPQSYRTIALESCFLKLMTGLIKERLVEMANSLNLLPPSQNGFRDGYRTNNNVFILRCAMDKADAEGKPLYAAFVDLTNAFPSTDQDALWLKLRKWGAGGPIFDWLRKLYRDMTYSVLHEGATSSDFKSSIGILIGDVCSPILWDIYMSDLPQCIPKDRDDVTLGSAHITNLEQADDIVLLSTTPEGLRRKLEAVYRWCSVNFMLFNASKSSIVIFTRNQPRTVPAFWVGDGEQRLDIAVVKSVVYLGFTLWSTPSSFVRKHYNAKAEQGKRAARVLSGVQQLVGTLPVVVATRLYMALIDPHLTHGCEVAVDCVKAALELLEEVQVTYLRMVLNVGKLCMLVILFTETGLLPIRYRRLELTIRFLQYASQCPPGHYVREALTGAIRLDFEGKEGWLGNLRKALRLLPFQCELPPHGALEDADTLDAVLDALKRGARSDLQSQIDASPKLYLLHNRMEPGDDGILRRSAVMKLRHYLKLNNTRHRVALARVILYGHKYGIEALRRTATEVLRENRLCRLCQGEVETPEHVWLEWPET